MAIAYMNLDMIRKSLTILTIMLSKNRQERYKQYWELRDNPDIEEMLNEITDEIVARKVTWSSWSDYGMKLMPLTKDAQNEIDWLMDYVIKDARYWHWAKYLITYGDLFVELIEHDKSIMVAQALPAETMYKIITTKGRIVEYQQSSTGPDYAAIASHRPIESDDKAEAIRFKPEQIVHFVLQYSSDNNDHYGQSILDEYRLAKVIREGTGCYVNAMCHGLRQIILRQFELKKLGITEVVYSYENSNSNIGS